MSSRVSKVINTVNVTMTTIVMTVTMMSNDDDDGDVGGYEDDNNDKMMMVTGKAVINVKMTMLLMVKVIIRRG